VMSGSPLMTSTRLPLIQARALVGRQSRGFALEQAHGSTDPIAGIEHIVAVEARRLLEQSAKTTLASSSRLGHRANVVELADDQIHGRLLLY
jgi:hypothetical protein